MHVSGGVTSTSAYIYIKYTSAPKFLAYRLTKTRGY